MEIEEIRVQSDIIKITYDRDTKVLTISSDFNPKIVDANFDELDERLRKVEKIVAKSRFINLKTNY